MTLNQLINQTRTWLDDRVQPYLWTDEFIIDALNSGQREASVRALCLPDRTTPAICTITLVAGQSTYSLDPRIIRIEEVLHNTSPQVVKLRAVTEESNEHEGQSWRTESGKPTRFFCDGRNVTVTPTPATDQGAGETLTLVVHRYPLEDMAADADVPEIEYGLHEYLSHWACYRAYQVPDVDASPNQSKAADHLAQFERVFGPMVSARVLLHQLRNPRSTNLTPSSYVRIPAQRADDTQESW